MSSQKTSLSTKMVVMDYTSQNPWTFAASQSECTWVGTVVKAQQMTRFLETFKFPQHLKCKISVICHTNLLDYSQVLWIVNSEYLKIIQHLNVDRFKIKHTEHQIQLNIAKVINRLRSQTTITSYKSVDPGRARLSFCSSWDASENLQPSKEA